MSCTLDYENDLARVRIDADTLCPTVMLVDTFTRSVTGGWGSSTSGHAWTVDGTASDYSVSSGVGRHNNITENAFRTSIVGVGTTDYDYSVSVQTDKLAVGGSSLVEVTARFTDTSNYYAARLTFGTSGAMSLDVRRRVAGVQTVLDSVVTGLTHVINTLYRVRLRVVGTTIKAKAWLASTTEPTDWTVASTDGSLTTGNNVALRSVLSAGTSNEPVMFSWDNLTATAPTYATIERTTDGFNYTIVRGGAEVGITTGCELERIIDDYEFPVGVEVTYRVRSYVEDDGYAASTECQITVDLDRVWLKSLGRPFLNRPLDCISDPTPIVRRARNTISPIVNRSVPVATTDTRGSREFTIRAVTQTTEQREDLDYLLASGDPVFLQTPAGYPIPTVYAVIADTAESRPVKNRSCSNDWRLFELPLVEVAAPGPDIVGTLGTWQTVLNTYSTWSDVLSNHATWASLLELIGDGNEVIVP